MRKLYKLEWNENRVKAAVDKNMGRWSKRSAMILANEARRQTRVGRVFRSTKPNQKEWQGRSPGSAKRSIRVVKSKFKKGGYLVVAGGYKTYYYNWLEAGAPKHKGGPLAMQEPIRKAGRRLKHRLRNMARRYRIR